MLLGLIGSPIGHSASPAMHEAAADAVGLRVHYQLIDVAGADQALLRVLLEGVRRLGFSGVNVTFPYKESVLPLLDELSDGARAIGAVNTIVVRGGRLVGHNTDSSGFGRAIVRNFGADLRGPFALIGAGGVGRAIAVALAGLSTGEIRIVDPDSAKAATLAAMLGRHASVRICQTVEDAMEGAAGVINGTPLGMLPDCRSPLPSALLRADCWVADAVYSPLWTPLLKAAKRVGAPVMTGRELAIDQGIDAFELFTGRSAPHSAMAAAFDAVTAARTMQADAA